MKLDKNVHIVLMLIMATILEAAGDAIIRKFIYQNKHVYCIILGILGAVLLVGYSVILNLAPFEFGKVLG